MASKLMLGTAGLGGVKYGDSDRITTKADMAKMVETCLEWGIYSFDTAPAYGHAEEWLGECLGNVNAQVMTKNQGSKDEAFRSMERLGKPVFLWHNYQAGNKIFPPWIEGATLYPETQEYPVRAKWLQVPWSILNQSCVEQLPDSVSVIARSVFLRGRLAGDTCDHADVNRLAKHFGVTVQVLALRAAIENDAIDKVLIGPQTDEELRRCIQIEQMPIIGVSRYLGLIDKGACEETDPRKFT